MRAFSSCSDVFLQVFKNLQSLFLYKTRTSLWLLQGLKFGKKMYTGTISKSTAVNSTVHISALRSNSKVILDTHILETEVMKHFEFI